MELNTVHAWRGLLLAIVIVSFFAGRPNGTSLCLTFNLLAFWRPFLRMNAESDRLFLPSAGPAE